MVNEKLKEAVEKTNYGISAKACKIGFNECRDKTNKLIDEWEKGMILRLETARNLEQIRYKDFDLFKNFINEKTKELGKGIIKLKPEFAQA